MPNAAKPVSQHKTTVLPPLVKSFERHLKAERKDPDTVAHYVGATLQFLQFCYDERLPVIENVTREHVEMWLESLHEKYRPHTVRNRYIGLRIFFRWLHAEGEIAKNPMARIKPPSIEESPKDVVSPDDIARVLKMLEKEKRWRDAALIAVLYDSGMRASELADLRTEHVDMDTGRVFIGKTKADRTRVVRLSPATVRMLDRYHRRDRANPEYVLCGPRGKLTRSGVYWAVRRCFEEAGVTGTIGAHDMRHTAATHMAGNIEERDMMVLFGWTDSAMARHYASQALAEAALVAHEKASPMERLKR